MQTRVHTLACSQKRFDAFAAAMAKTLGADMVLSSADYPAQTESVVGINPTDEMVFTSSTTAQDIKCFCFEEPRLILGFISYDFGMILRGVGSDKPLEFPLGHLRKYEGIVEFDGVNITLTGDDNLLRTMLEALESVAPSLSVHGLPEATPSQSLNQANYEAEVEDTLERILSGYTYQLNLSTKLSWDCPDLDPLALLMALRQDHPAPFYSWFTSGEHRIISTSPERFLRVADGQVLSQPIKGTLRVEDDDPAQERLLTESPKESAELSMIVDLIRNDISTNCEYGSVKVENHKSVFRVDNLLQMYSDVRGRLRDGRDCIDLFLDAFPGGSITGCPKKSSMEIIEELEPHRRGVYCGSMVIIRDKRNMDSSIAIRTGVFNETTGKLDVYAGSGIVVDSIPAKEYQETMAKAEKFLTMGDK